MIRKPVISSVNVLLHPLLFISSSRGRQLGKSFAQKLRHRAAMDERIVNDQGRERQGKTIPISPRYSRLKIALVEEFVLDLSHLRIIPAGIPQQLLKLTVVNQRRYTDLFEVKAELPCVNPTEPSSTFESKSYSALKNLQC